ncbi:phage tail tube protein, partial [Bacillus sp. HC-TM]
MPVKGAGTTLWVYKGSGDPYANPLSDVDWSRLAKVKDLTPGTFHRHYRIWYRHSVLTF